MRIAASVIMVVGLCVTGCYSFAQVKMSKTEARELQSKLDDLKAQADQVKADLEKADQEKASLASEEMRLDSTADLLKGAFQNLKADTTKYVMDRNAQAQAVKTHNDNVCKFPTGHPEVCASYEAERQRLVAWGNQVVERRKTLSLLETGLNARQGDLSRATMDWAMRKKQNEAARMDLQYKQRDVIAKIRQLSMDDKLLRDLRIRTKMSQDCKELLDTSLDRASQCLQIVWDGASKLNQTPPPVSPYDVVKKAPKPRQPLKK